MTSKDSKKLQQKLEMYQQTIQQYQQTILNQPDADTSELDALVQTVKELIASIQTKLNNCNQNTDTVIPTPFQKNVEQLTTAVEKIKTQIQQLLETQTLEKHKDKVGKKLQTFEAALEKLRTQVTNYEEAVQEACRQLLEQPLQTLKELRATLTGQPAPNSDGTSDLPNISTSSELRAAIQLAQKSFEQLKTKLNALGINL